MESSIFATTALIATAGIASADVTLGGGAVAGLKNTGTGDAFLHYEIDIDIKAAGETDNGLSFGASMDLDELSGSTDPEIFVSGAFGTVTLGAVDIATDGLGLPDLGFDGIGMDDDVEALRNAGSSDVNYKYSFGDLAMTISYGVGGTNGVDASEGDYGILLGYKVGSIALEAGVASDDSSGDRAMGVEVGYAANNLSVTFLWASKSAAVDSTGYGLNVGYTMGDLALGASYGSTDIAGDEDDYGVGASYKLGGGLSVVGAAGSVDGNTVWDLGLTMSF